MKGDPIFGESGMLSFLHLSVSWNWGCPFSGHYQFIDEPSALSADVSKQALISSWPGNEAAVVVICCFNRKEYHLLLHLCNSVFNAGFVQCSDTNFFILEYYFRD